jgi:hypothetical protein
LNIASTGSTPDVLYQYHMTDTTQTVFGATPTSNLTSVGNCFFAPPLLYDKPSDYDAYVDKVFIGDYAGFLHRLILDGTNIANSDMERIFADKNGTPIYSVPFAAEIYLAGTGRKTLLSFSEYGSPVDPTLGTQKNGVAYCLVEENLPSGLTQASSLVQSTGTSSSFNPATSLGFYYVAPSPLVEGESIPFRPTLFWDGDVAWMAFTSYLFFPHALSGGPPCDPVTHTVNAGHSKAYVFDLRTGRYLSSQEPMDLGIGSTFYGRASAFHKGARGEGWIDIGTGDTWGWGYSDTTQKFEKFDTSKGNVTYDMNPTAGVEVHNNYWREFK